MLAQLKIYLQAPSIPNMSHLPDPAGRCDTIRPMVTCSGCGAVSSENVRFCSSCGRAIAILDTPTLEPDRNVVMPVPVPISSHSPRNGGFSPGTVLVERYRIVALLGRGGMGEVYRAEDLKLGNVVALKLLPASLQNDPAALAGFHAEVRNARQVSHPNVCRVYDIGEVNGQHFLTMEYIDGEDLASLLRRIGRLPADKALETAHQICAGLRMRRRARTDLCGGRSVMVVPTATTNRDG